MKVDKSCQFMIIQMANDKSTTKRPFPQKMGGLAHREQTTYTYIFFEINFMIFFIFYKHDD